jgi:hypothetical protein
MERCSSVQRRISGGCSWLQRPEALYYVSENM